MEKKSFCNKKAVIVALTALASGFGPVVSFVQIDPKSPPEEALKKTKERCFEFWP